MPCRLCLLLGSTALLLASTGAAAPCFADDYWTSARLNKQQLEYRVVPRPNPNRRFVWVRRWVWDNFWGDYHLQWVPHYYTYRTVSYVRTHKAHTARDGHGSGESSSQEHVAGTTDTAATDNAKPDDAKPDKETKTASLEPGNLTAEKEQKPTSSAASAISKPLTPEKNSPKAETNAAADPSKPLTPSEIRAAIPLTKVADPKQTLASTPIKSVWGDTLGKVRDINMSGNSIKTIDASVVGKGAVKINAGQLKYVKSRGLLITTLSKSDTAKLPHADQS